jgi:hypothetical protein
MSEHARRFEEFKIKITPEENWPPNEMDGLFESIRLFADIMGGRESFRQCLGEVTIERTDTGPNLGLAYRDRIKLSAKAPVSSWSVIHELAHVWDAKNDWKLSGALEKYTHGFTNPFLSSLRRFIPGQWDAGMDGPQKQPGRHGRKPGCNAHGYFYGDKPSGANWRFNRKEDFAESVVMYCGWGRDNELSQTAHGRIERYLLSNQSKDPVYGIADNWSDYANYFYPQGGDYTKTKRWQFIHKLMESEIKIPL